MTMKDLFELTRHARIDFTSFTIHLIRYLVRQKLFMTANCGTLLERIPKFKYSDCEIEIKSPVFSREAAPRGCA